MLFVSMPNSNETTFNQFWAVYPRRVNKKEARKAWDQLHPPPELVTEILAALAWQVRQPQWLKDDGAFIPHAATWLRAERWEDEPPISLRSAAKWCEHEPECVTQTEHTTRWLSDQRGRVEA